jgi:hypothetical protein
VRTPTEDRSAGTKDSFYEELERIFDQFPKYRMKILLRDIDAKVGREGIFKLTMETESFREISDDHNRFREVNFATLKSVIVKSTIFPHCNIHK